MNKLRDMAEWLFAIFALSIIFTAAYAQMSGFADKDSRLNSELKVYKRVVNKNPEYKTDIVKIEEKLKEMDKHRKVCLIIFSPFLLCGVASGVLYLISLRDEE
jgi:hypothetical protein